MTTAILKQLAAATALVASAHTAFAGPLLGTWLPADATVNLWMVNLDPNGTVVGGNHGVNAIAANVPGSPADLTFQTNLIQYTTEFKADTIQGLFVPGVVKNPLFSGLFNPLVGGAVNANTELWSETCSAADLNGLGCWGTLVDITGTININTGGHIKIDHDDGVSLKLNGLWTDCFKDGGGQHFTANANVDTCIYTGPSGLVNFELIYTEGYGGGARLTMAIPEPDPLSLVGIALGGLGFATRRQRRM